MVKISSTYGARGYSNRSVLDRLRSISLIEIVIRFHKFNLPPFIRPFVLIADIEREVIVVTIVVTIIRRRASPEREILKTIHA